MSARQPNRRVERPLRGRRGAQHEFRLGAIAQTLMRLAKVHGQTTARSFIPFARSICALRARLLSRQGKSDLASEKIEEMVTIQVGSHPGNLDFIDSLADCAFTWGLSGNGCERRT